MFAIVDFGDWSSRPPILLERESLRGDTPPSRETRQDFTTDVRASTEGKSWYSVDTQQPPARLAHEIAPCLAASMYKEPPSVMQLPNKPYQQVVGALCARDCKGVGNQYVAEGKLVVEKAVYSFDSLASNSMKSKNPHSGCRQVELAKCLDTSNGCPSKNQGGLAVVSLNSKQMGLDTSETLASTLCANDYKEPQVVAIAGNIIGRAPKNGGNHNGFHESGACYTLTMAHSHAVAYGCLNPDQPQCWRVYETNGVAPALQAGEGRGNAILQPPSVVRRLTPIECEKLQGFPVDFTKIPYRNKPADDCPNGVRYKALGNSMAVNVMAWIGQRVQMAVGVKAYVPNTGADA